MTTDIEDRLRADLPRLAELIEHDPTPVVAAVQPVRQMRRVVAVGIAACVALAAVVVGVVVRSGHHEHVSTTTPSVEVTPSTWRALPPSPLGPLGNSVVVWTGTEVLVWGGYRGSSIPLAFQSGAAYRPTTNTWRKIADNHWAHPGAIGVWGGDRMYVLAKNGGAYYLPATNEWHDLPQLENERQSGFIGAAASGTTLYGIVYSGDPKHPAIEPFVYKPGYRGWHLGAVLPTALSVTRPSTAWTGNELVVADTRAVSAYNPAHDSWRTLPLLPGPATSTSLTMSNGSLVAVFANDGGLSSARLDGSDWHVIATADSKIEQPHAVDAGGSLAVIDRAGIGAPVRVDEPSGSFVPLNGYPLQLGVGGNAVWAGNGLFVWNGLPSGTPPTFANPTPDAPDAAWYGN
jgi:hypothetical protein